MKRVKPTLYLIRGIPGSGKSSFAETLLQAGVVQYHFEADQYFIDETGMYNFNPANLHLAHKSCYTRTKHFLGCNFSVAVSNTSTTEKEVQTYKELAEELGCNFVSVVVEHRHEGTNLHNVPAEKIQQMKDRFSICL